MKIKLFINQSEKDVDGFHPENIKNDFRFTKFFPATPNGIMELKRYNIPTEGKSVVIGRSNIVGTPVSILAV